MKNSLKDNRPTKKAEAQVREQKAWELRSKGWTHQRIADELKVDVSTITKGLQRSASKHHDEFMADINEYKKKQVQAIEAAAFNALEQYYKSQEPKKIVTENGKPSKDGKKLKVDSVSTQKVDQYGDPRLLAMFYKGMEDIRKIWGFDIPAKNPETKNSLANLSVDEKVAMFCSLPLDDRLRLLDSMITIRPGAGEPPLDIEGEDSPE